MANKWFLKNTIDRLENITFAGLDGYADILKQEVQRDAPGSLKDGIVTRKNRVALKVTVASTHKSGLPVPVFVEFGTAPHKITPKTAKALRWIGDSGDVIFAKRVFHPGTTPNPYMRRGVNRAIKKAGKAFG